MANRRSIRDRMKKSREEEIDESLDDVDFTEVSAHKSRMLFDDGIDALDDRNGNLVLSEDDDEEDNESREMERANRESVSSRRKTRQMDKLGTNSKKMIRDQYSHGGRKMTEAGVPGKSGGSPTFDRILQRVTRQREAADFDNFDDDGTGSTNLVSIDEIYEMLDNIEIRPGVHYANLPLDDQWTLTEPVFEMSLHDYADEMRPILVGKSVHKVKVSTTDCAVLMEDGDFCGEATSVLCENPRSSNIYGVCSDHIQVVERNSNLVIKSINNSEDLEPDDGLDLVNEIGWDFEGGLVSGEQERRLGKAIGRNSSSHEKDLSTEETRGKWTDVFLKASKN